MNKPNKIDLLVGSLKKANDAALNIENKYDGGTCNLDSVVIKLNRWTSDQIQELESKSGVSVGGQLSGYFKGYRILGIPTHGQANLRSRMVKTAYKTLVEDGYDVRIYYAMD